MEEELRTPGVNGRRFRRLFKQYTPFTARTAFGSDSYATSNGYASDYLSAIGRIAYISTTVGGQSLQYPSVKILGVSPMVGVGSYISQDNTFASLIMADWSLVAFADASVNSDVQSVFI